MDLSRVQVFIPGAANFLAHPSLASRAAVRCFATILALRALFVFAAVPVLNSLVEFGTLPHLLSTAAIVGIAAGGCAAFSRFRFPALVLGCTALYFAFRLLLLPVGAMSLNGRGSVLFSYSTLLHGNLLLAFFCTGAFSTWLFWKWRHTLTVELILLASVTVYLLSGHREFHFDTPKIVNTLAWQLGIGNLAAFIMIGAGVVLSLWFYVHTATLPSSPRPESKSVYWRGARPRFVLGGLLASIGLLLVYFVSRGVYAHYNKIAISLTSNGVGQEDEEGLSPLGFHSALGSTNQPAALVRLEGDYAENPFSPMLYLRESALSALGTNELVRAEGNYDADISFGSPADRFLGKEDPELSSRVPLVHSIYTLTEHQKAFAVDYPVTITPIKNPAPKRFRGTFQAYSYAPGFSLEELRGLPIGDKRWSDDEWKHYLKLHPDERYAELANEIAGDRSEPAAKAFALVEYLNKTSIYTLTPNHTVEPGQDPVAPFLFGDHRGYCVHFAHATVYMLRALGIPARIATGYLTDLSQARDGHILLRMSDRHAWAEVYFEGRGWIPFDTQPEQVESHADTEVDSKLLEELMGMLEPSEEILPKDIAANEPGMEEPARFPFPDREDVLFALALVACLIALGKLYLRFAWLLPSGPARKIRRAYVALASYLADLGYPRRFGETREEYRHRLRRELGAETLRMNSPLLSLVYGSIPPDWDHSTIKDLYGKDVAELKKLGRMRRLAAAINPASLVTFLWGGRW